MENRVEEGEGGVREGEREHHHHQVLWERRTQPHYQLQSVQI